MFHLHTPVAGIEIRTRYIKIDTVSGIIKLSFYCQQFHIIQKLQQLFFQQLQILFSQQIDTHKIIDIIGQITKDQRIPYIKRLADKFCGRNAPLLYLFQTLSRINVFKTKFPVKVLILIDPFKKEKARYIFICQIASLY